jgi:large subunit ribosomal protein L4
MTRLPCRTQRGDAAGELDAPDAVFGQAPNVALLHQVVTAQLAAARSGTHSTKTRAEVAGGGAKPWRQKGTGRARHGSIRAPQWRGGGVAHGPKPRDYRQRTPKKMVRAALAGALSDRAAHDRVLVVDRWEFAAPRTKDAVRALEALGLRPVGERPPRVLVVLERTEEAAWKSFRNLGPRLAITMPEELSAYDVLRCDWVVFSRASLARTCERFGHGSDLPGAGADPEEGAPGGSGGEGDR